jgi:hypothetical protein
VKEKKVLEERNEWNKLYVLWKHNVTNVNYLVIISFIVFCCYSILATQFHISLHKFIDLHSEPYYL